MALILDLKIVPNAKNNKIILDKSGIISIHVKAPPIDGKANKEFVKLLSSALDINQIDIEIISGLISKRKRVKIHKPLTLNYVMNKLGFDIQTSLK